MGEKDIAQKILEAHKDEQVSVMECQQKLVHGIDVKGCCDCARKGSGVLITAKYGRKYGRQVEIIRV